MNFKKRDLDLDVEPPGSRLGISGQRSEIRFVSRVCEPDVESCELGIGNSKPRCEPWVYKMESERVDESGAENKKMKRNSMSTFTA